MRRRRGAVLIIVLGALFALALMGTVLLLLASSERTVSLNYLDQVRAGRLARSGVAAAVAALSADPFDPNLKYWGNDEDEDGERSGIESPEDAMHVQDVPLDAAQNPSLAVEKDGDPTSGSSATRKYTVVDPEGRTITFGISGHHSGSTYGLESDVYQVKARDASSCLHLNDGAGQHGGNESSVSQNLKRMLNVLGNLATVNVPHLGDRVLGARPPDGFGSINDLERHFTREEMIRIRPFVASHNWVDRNVANPVPLSETAAKAYPVKYYRGTLGVYRRGLGRGGQLRWFEDESTDRGHCAIYAMDEVNPSYIEIVQRAPVNVNGARKEVLIALLSNLQGFFISERRAFSPYVPSPTNAFEAGTSIPQKYYSWWTVHHTYDSQGMDGDEYGFIYRTQPIAPVAPGRTTSDDVVSAATIADHIIACRERRRLGPIHYGMVWFGGPFRTWSQFNRFVDNLVEMEVIRDTRPIFFDYDARTWEGLVTQESKAARKFASYAIADVLKANFNPNLHLNELNPDANLYLRVDKTDLIVNSTEFSFMPTGVYEIESLGRVLKPVTGNRTQTSSLFTVEAQRRACTSVRVFEPYRETSQRHFAGGLIHEKSRKDLTSSGFALELGPEPAVGANVDGDHYGEYATKARFDEDGYRGYPSERSSVPTGWGYEFDGYIALSTLGGRNPQDKDGACPGGHWPVALAADREGMHVHFNEGFDAAHNSGFVRTEQAAKGGMNFPDPLSPPGPLWVGNGAVGAHRLARSFRLPRFRSEEPPPHLLPFAPGDLRSDGFYSERNGGASYVMRQAIQEGISRKEHGNFTVHGGVLSLWVKPSFFPEHTGKARNIVSMSKYHKKRGYRSPTPFNLMFLPAHDKPAYEESDADEIGIWAPRGGSAGNPKDPPRHRGGPIAPACEFLENKVSYYGNVHQASREVPVELRGYAHGVWQFRPASFMAVRAATTADAGSSDGPAHPPDRTPDLVDVENYALTSCLNHNLHPHGLDSGSTPNSKAVPEEQRPNYLEAHRWTHVLLSWQILPPF